MYYISNTEVSSVSIFSMHTYLQAYYYYIIYTANCRVKLKLAKFTLLYYIILNPLYALKVILFNLY